MLSPLVSGQKMAGEEKHTIDGIELYLFQVDKPLHFSFGTWMNRQHIFLRIISGQYEGWSEHNAGRNDPGFDLEAYAQDLNELTGVEINEALEKIRTLYGNWGWGKLEVMELALYDLLGKIRGVPSVKLLGLERGEAIPGLFCVLEEDPLKAEAQARLSLENNFRTHIKVKLFGNQELDAQLVRNVRKVMGNEAYVTADVNTGYKGWNSIEELVGSMEALHEAGLDACEDPAKLEISQWVTLQEQLPELDIIPDYIMRPAWETLETSVKGMGNIYNLHPHCMGSIHLTVELARRIQGWGAKLMIGDASLIGPACSQWQQIAIGLGADWVEALEKPGESDPYLDCVQSLATFQQADGRIAMDPEPGFGIKLDLEKIKKSAVRCYIVK